MKSNNIHWWTAVMIALGLGGTCAAGAPPEPRIADRAAPTTAAHYVVFEVDAAGRVEPVFHANVRMHAAASAILATQARSPRRDGAAVAWQLRQGSAVVGSYRSELAPLRGEFAREPGVDDAIVSAPVIESAVRSFVVRVPVGAGDSLQFDGAAMPQRFDLAQLAVRAPTLRLADVPLPLVPAAGPPGNRLDLLVFGDGYTAAQQAQFTSDANLLRSSLFAVTPYMEYANFINWVPVFQASVQSGADHPAYQAGCTSAACCADPAAQGDPRAGQFVNTAFDAAFCYGQTHRLLVPNYGKVFAAAAAYPDWDAILVVVNDPVYGGSGGGMSVASMHPAADEIVLHELGHSITGLADEYSTPYPGYPACSDTAGSAPCEANATNQTNAALVKWRAWFTAGNPIPTPAGTAGVGLFQGARYQSVGMYRPVDTQCEMQYLGQPFCPVCRQEYVRVLQLGGWGVPADGIDLIEPGSESPLPTQPVAYAPGTTLTFRVDLLRPSIGNLAVEWWLDGVRQNGPWTDSYPFMQAAATPATRTLELRVRDTSAYVADPLPTRTRTWTIQVDGDRIFADGYD